MDICEINPKAVTLEDNTLVSFVAMPDVSENGKIKVDTFRPYGEVKKGFTCFKEGDVLFAKITPCMENGKGALAIGLKNGFGCGSTEFHVLRPKENMVIGKWLYYLTTWPAFRVDAERHMTGSAGQKRVPKTFLEKYELEVPSLKIQEQQVIQLDRLRKIIDLRKQQLAALDELIKARFVEMFGDPVRNSKQLPSQKMGEICDLKAGDFTAAEDIYEVQDNKNPYPCYGGNGIRGYVNNYTQEGEFPIIGRQGALCGNIQYAKGKFRNTEHAVLVTPKVELDKIWLFELLKLEDLYRFHTGAAQPGLAVKTLNMISVPLAELEEQKIFAKFFNQINKTKDVVQNALDKTQTLFNSLMQQYFG